MPILKVQTNEKIQDPESFKFTATEMLATLLQKPENYIMIILEQGDIIFAGEPGPAVYCELKSIGLPEERTAELSEAMCAFLESQLNIPPDRIYIEFTHTDRHMLGWNGKTFA